MLRFSITNYVPVSDDTLDSAPHALTTIKSPEFSGLKNPSAKYQKSSLIESQIRNLLISNKSTGLNNSVYQGRTRPLHNGFDEDAMYAQFKKLPAAIDLSAEMRELGFKYVGDTETSSKANTDFSLKTIRIKKDLSSNEAALSLVYELKNASQAKEFETTLALLKKPGTPELANTYAEGILRKEAKSVLLRSQMAIALQCEELVKNKRYNEIAKDNNLSDVEKEEKIYDEMKQNGTVHQGKKKAFDHYVEQFWAYNSTS